MALASYLLTGQICDGEVGSPVMFAIPRGVGELAMEENFLQVTHCKHHIGQLCHHCIALPLIHRTLIQYFG